MEEIEFQIRVIGDPILVKVAKPVKEVTERHRKALSQMSRLMYEVAGVGLAAPQVGISEAMFVADTGSGLYKLINPKIIKQEGVQAIEEGCLSVPGVSVKVKRAKIITLEAIDEFGKKVCLEVEDMLACVFQHELDHLKGKLIIEYSPDKEKIKKKLAQQKKG